MNKLRLATVSAVVPALLAGCASGSSGPNGIPKISSSNPLASGKLQFAVGTANLYGTGTGLNVVSTYRQADGLSNVLVDTPTITGPFTLPPASPAGDGIDAYSTLPDGPSVEEVAAGGEMTGTSQTVHPGTPACDSTAACSEPSASGGNVSIAPNTSTFGQSGGVFVNGLSPGNSNTMGVASSYVPYTEPLFDTSSGNEFVPFGGPPAFPGDANGLGLRDGLSNIGAGVLGIPLGITAFSGVTPAAGTYTLSLSVPTGDTNSVATFGTVATSAAIATAAVLPTITAPTLVLDGNGGGTFAIGALPAGVTEELVQITDFGVDGGGPSCQGTVGASESALPVYYTILVKAAGTYSLPDTIGPNTTITSGVKTITPSPSICTAAQNTTAAGAATAGDTYTVQSIGADYPLYESLYPNDTTQSPAIVGAAGQDDITISAISPTELTSMVRARIRKSLHRRHG